MEYLFYQTNPNHHRILPILPPFVFFVYFVVKIQNKPKWKQHPKKQNEPKYALFNRKFIPQGSNLKNLSPRDRKLQNEPKLDFKTMKLQNKANFLYYNPATSCFFCSFF